MYIIYSILKYFIIIHYINYCIPIDHPHFFHIDINQQDDEERVLNVSDDDIEGIIKKNRIQ